MDVSTRNHTRDTAIHAWVAGILLCLSMTTALSVDAPQPSLKTDPPPTKMLDVEQHLQKAFELLGAGDIETALRETTLAYELAPDRLDVMIQHGILLVQLQRYGQAIPLLRETLARLLQPNDLDRSDKDGLIAITRSTLANSLLNDQAQWPEAQRLCREVLDYIRALQGPLPEGLRQLRLITSVALSTILDQRTDRAEIVRLYREALDDLKLEAQADPAHFRPTLADTEFRLAGLVDSDRDAAKHYRAALTQYRLLPGKPSDRTRFRIAMALNFLGFLTSKEPRHWQEAEDRYRESLKLLRELAADGSPKLRSALAATLNNLANLLKHRPGLHDEAGALYVEAIAIRKQLAATGLPRYRFDYAKTLLNWTVFLDDHNESEHRYRTVLTIFRQLARENPAAYQSNVLIPLGLLAREIRLDPARHAEAESLLEEAVSLGESLIDASRDPLIRSTHARNMVPLAEMIQSRDGDRARQYFREVLRICRPLSGQASSDCDIARADAGLDLARLLSEQPARHAEARALYQESLKPRRAVLDQDKPYHLPRLAATLYGLAKLERDLPRKRAIAETHLREAITLFGKAADWYPENRLLLAQAQRDLAALAGDNGKRDENSEKPLREALAIDRQRPQGDPGRLLAVTLDLGEIAELIERRPERRDEAEAHYREALRLLDQASARDTDTRFRRSWLLYKLGNLLVVDPEHAREAAQLLNQSIDLYRELADEDPGQYTRPLAEALFSLGRAWYFNLRDKTKAVTYLREAARTGASDAEKDPGEWGDRQATALNLLALADEDLDRFERCELLLRARRFARSDKIRKEGARVEKQLRCDVWH